MDLVTVQAAAGYIYPHHIVFSCVKLQAWWASTSVTVDERLCRGKLVDLKLNVGMEHEATGRANPITRADLNGYTAEMNLFSLFWMKCTWEDILQLWIFPNTSTTSPLTQRSEHTWGLSTLSLAKCTSIGAYLWEVGIPRQSLVESAWDSFE